MILAVDLAAKFSAACLMDVSGTVVCEIHSWGIDPHWWATSVAVLSDRAEVVLVEDLPFSIGQTKTTRDAYRVQGRVVQELDHRSQGKKLVWTPPILWQSHFEGMRTGKKLTSKHLKDTAKKIAEEKYGYTPPQLLHKDLHGIDRTHARKTMEDHIDAFLMARYMLEQAQEHGSIDAAVEAIPRLERFYAS